MYRVTFECETITPMFLAGADGITPELRVPSIKGALRFWWRAMNGYLPVNELRKKEAEIFGGVAEQKGKSELILRLDFPNQQDVIGTNLKNDYGLKWQFSGGKLAGPHAGIGYLLYSTTLKGRERPFFRAQGKFQSSFRFSLTIKSRKEGYLKHAVAAFWVLAHLGGLGTRVRRGAGNIAVTSVEDPYQIISSMKLN